MVPPGAWLMSEAPGGLFSSTGFVPGAVLDADGASASDRQEPRPVWAQGSAASADAVRHARR